MEIDPVDLIIDSEANDQISNRKVTKNVNEDYLSDFLIETKEHLESIEVNILVLEKEPLNTEIIYDVFRDFHTIKGLAGFVSQSLVQKIAHKIESALDKCRKNNLEIPPNLIEQIYKAIDYINSICNNLDLTSNNDFIEEVLIFINSIEIDDCTDKTIKKEDVFVAKNTTGELESDFNFEKNEMEVDDIVENIIGVDKHDQVAISKNQNEREDLVYVRIPIQKLDQIVEFVSELIITHSQFEQEASTLILQNTQLSSNLSRAISLTKDIQNVSMSLRMVSLKPLFQRIYSIGNDTVLKLGKKADISFQGEDTEIDRDIVEKLVDPMMHLIKNSIYHGIENQNERTKNGKPKIGKVEMIAYSSKGHVYITISDDGRGIDTEKVLKNAIKKNLINPFIDYSDEEILNFVFLPGLSTLETADSISGRGVGLDVVKNQISRLGGRVEINNNPGKGCSFTMKMPINMAIMKGTIVEIAGALYIIPTVTIHSIIKSKPTQFIEVNGVKNGFEYNGKLISIIEIEEILGVEKTNKTDDLLVILETGDKKKALPVDYVIENRDVIVKTLDRGFEKLHYVFGATILGNGRIALILDVESFFEGGR